MILNRIEVEIHVRTWFQYSTSVCHFAINRFPDPIQKVGLLLSKVFADLFAFVLNKNVYRGDCSFTFNTAVILITMLRIVAIQVPAIRLHQIIMDLHNHGM